MEKPRAAVFGLVVLILFGSTTAAQDDRARAEALARRAADRMQALQQEADRLATDERTILGELRKLEIDREIKIERARQLEADAVTARADLSDATAKLESLEREEAAGRPQLRARLVEIYKLGEARYARLLLSSDLRRIGQASRAVAAVAKLDRDRIAAHQRTIAELRATRETLEERTRRLASVAADARRAAGDVERAAAARADMIRKIDEARDLNAQLTGELQVAQQKLQTTLRTLSTGPGAAADVAVLPLRPFRGALDWPAAGAVRRRFTRPTPGQPATNGIEIAAEEGAAVAAVHEGTVAFAGPFAGFGNLVIVQHAAQTFSLYGNLADVAVKQGDQVEAGRPVGRVGLSPAGPAGLYFELRDDGQPDEPLQWLKRK